MSALRLPLARHLPKVTIDKMLLRAERGRVFFAVTLDELVATKLGTLSLNSVPDDIESTAMKRTIRRNAFDDRNYRR